MEEQYNKEKKTCPNIRWEIAHLEAHATVRSS